ncbi:formamidopyrimidine-DNA glycosylase [candidate division KSB1 bacterium]|nr:MAG: formamidopyrimidine-DNA glycosylase [candidate division KSB1 bacterium]
MCKRFFSASAPIVKKKRGKMPELPEVETIVQGLKPKLAQQKIGQLRIYDPKIERMLVGEYLSGRRIINIRRRGKYIVFELNGDLDLIVHLRMSGGLLYQQNEPQSIRWVRAVMKLDDGFLIFQDRRRLGVMELSHSRGLDLRLGMEPLSSDFNSDYLRQKLAGSRRPIKVFLMDQTIVAGIGNIYAQEILFVAGVHPQREARSLNNNEIRKLVKATKSILAMAIKHQGTTVSDFQNADASEGNFQNFLKVYGRNNKPCLVCGTVIRKIKLQGRTTYFCEKCQK